MIVEIAVVKLDGSMDQPLDAADAIFAEEFKEPLVHQVVTAYLAGGRSGSSSQKNRSDVRGGGRTPWRQKGKYRLLLHSKSEIDKVYSGL